MRTNIVINDQLINKAMSITGLTTKRAVVEKGLETLIKLNNQKNLKKLKGLAKWEGDLNKMRNDK